MFKTAYVHTNKDNSLKVISNLVVQNFFTVYSWSCLLNQFVYTFESLVGSNYIDSYLADSSPKKDKSGLGHTAQSIVSWANRKLDNLKVFLHGYAGLDDALQDVLAGQPVVMIISNENPMWSQTSKISKYTKIDGAEVGEVTKCSGDILIPPSIGYHAVLLIGYDSKHDFLIFRESTMNSGVNGYFKAKRSLISNATESVRFLSFKIKEV